MSSETALWYRVRARTASLLDVPGPDDTASRLIDIGIMALILVNVAAVILGSVRSLQTSYATVFVVIEWVSVVIFTLEYLLRVWSIVDNRWRREYAHPLWGRLRFMRSPLALIDLLAVAPFWLSMFFPMDLRFLRVVRLLRILKLTRYSAAANLLFEVIRNEAKVIAAAMFVLGLVIVVIGSAAFLVEQEAQPDAFSNIPQAMWWAIVTATTVGYGDVVPITAEGKVLAALLSMIGVGMVALPAGILSSGFSDALARRRHSLQREYHRALEDGVVDDQERAHLRSRAEDFNLSADEVEDILEQDDDARSRLMVCPHCGKPISEHKP